MLTPLEVFLFLTATLLLLPIAIVSLLGGMTAPESFASKYYHAEKYLYFCSNIFLLAVCATSLNRLGQHFGFIPVSARDTLDVLIEAPFMVLMFINCALWVRALVKVRRMEKESN